MGGVTWAARFNKVARDVPFVADTLVDVELTYVEGNGGAKFVVEWNSPTDTTYQKIPDSAFFSSQRVDGSKDLTLLASAVPASCTLES